MLTENKNLKDIEESNTNISTEKSPSLLSYTKTQKLITALYIVTDIIEKEEPIRNRLRTLGVEILSDISIISKNSLNIERIDQILSFLSIVSTLNFISEMNHTILKKEFLELRLSIQEYNNDLKPKWLEEFLAPSFENIKSNVSNFSPSINSKGHIRIGVQNGDTLLKALNKAKEIKTMSDTKSSLRSVQDLSLLKKERRYNIINIIKNNGGSSTIKDIKDKINTGEQKDLSFSEKTLQRELMSMIKDNVLNKTGKKRWSKYFLKQAN